MPKVKIAPNAAQLVSGDAPKPQDAHGQPVELRLVSKIRGERSDVHKFTKMFKSMKLSEGKDSAAPKPQDAHSQPAELRLLSKIRGKLSDVHKFRKMFESMKLGEDKDSALELTCMVEKANFERILALSAQSDELLDTLRARAIKLGILPAPASRPHSA